MSLETLVRRIATQVRWRRGSWSVSPSGRDVILTER